MQDYLHWCRISGHFTLLRNIRHGANQSNVPIQYALVPKFVLINTRNVKLFKTKIISQSSNLNKNKRRRIPIAFNPNNSRSKNRFAKFNFYLRTSQKSSFLCFLTRQRNGNSFYYFKSFAKWTINWWRSFKFWFVWCKDLFLEKCS